VAPAGEDAQARRLLALTKKENDSLRAENEALREQVETLRAQVEAIRGRLEEEPG
jgi:cell division protein FtsB